MKYFILVLIVLISLIHNNENKYKKFNKWMSRIINQFDEFDKELEKYDSKSQINIRNDDDELNDEEILTNKGFSPLQGVPKQKTVDNNNSHYYLIDDKPTIPATNQDNRQNYLNGLMRNNVSKVSFKFDQPLSLPKGVYSTTNPFPQNLPSFAPKMPSATNNFLPYQITHSYNNNMPNSQDNQFNALPKQMRYSLQTSHPAIRNNLVSYPESESKANLSATAMKFRSPTITSNIENYQPGVKLGNGVTIPYNYLSNDSNKQKLSNNYQPDHNKYQFKDIGSKVSFIEHQLKKLNNTTNADLHHLNLIHNQEDLELDRKVKLQTLVNNTDNNLSINITTSIEYSKAKFKANSKRLINSLISKTTEKLNRELEHIISQSTNPIDSASKIKFQENEKLYLRKIRKELQEFSNTIN